MDVDTGDEVRFETDGAVAILTLSNPETLNAISLETVEGILRGMNAVSREDSGIRCLLVTGEGRAFSSGLNLRRRRDDRAPVPRIDSHFNPLIRRMRTIPIPVVMAVNGPCVGIAATMAILGDSILAARSAYFYLPFVWQLAFPGDAGISWILPRMVGWPRARRMLLHSERVPAATALEWGLVDELWDDAEFRERALEHARRLAAGPTKALGMVRRMLWSGLENSFEDQLRWEVESSIPLAGSRDAIEASKAFLEKRTPTFEGR